MAGPTPQLVALLMCDQAFQQAHTGNWCVIGAFDTIHAPELPFTHPGFTIWVALSDFQGETMLELMIRDEQGEPVKGLRGQIPKVPLGLFQNPFPCPEVEFKTEGVHTLELFAGGSLITLRSFRVVSAASMAESESEIAERLGEEHGAALAHEAVGIWTTQPDAKLCGLIATPDAATAEWFRRLSPTPIPGGIPFVGLVPREVVEQILTEQAAEAMQFLDPPPELADKRILPILIATRNGFKIGHRDVDG